MAHEAVEILSRYIRINTTNPPGNEAPAAAFLRGILNAEGIACSTYEAAPGRVSLSARIEGAGVKEPLVLLNHMDVVPANPDDFSFDPFCGEVRDGYICGRGALDMKGLGVMQLMACIAMKRTGARLNRDLVFLAVADEEEGGALGVRYLLENHPEDFRAGLVLNEGAYGITGMLPGTTAMMISPAEKGPCWLRLTRRGEPGHGSSPHGQNTLVKLVQALNRLIAAELPVTITDTVEEYFRELASHWSFLEPYRKDGMRETLARILSQSGLLAVPQLNAMVRNTISLNMMNSGVKLNVIPDRAEALLDIRLLPGQKVDEFIDFVRQALADDDIVIETILASQGSVSDTRGGEYLLLREAVASNFPGAIIPPSLLPGISDSRFFRERGVPAYGFCPLEIPMDHLKMIHGIDEKISAEGLARGCDIYADVVMRLCS